MLCAQTLRQLLISISLTVCSISDGFIFGQMSGMIDALSKKDSPISMITENDLWWMASSINILCFFGYVIMGTITDLWGRKKAISIISLPATVCWTLIYFANNKTLLIFTRIVLGVSFGGICGLLIISIGEYQPSHMRGLCMTMIGGVGSAIGAALGHVLSVLLNWRHVALIGVIPSGLSVILPLFWVESPSWLASKGRYDESEKAFHALHVRSETSDNELRLLLAYEMKKRNDIVTSASKVFIGKNIANAVKQTYFWRIALFSTVVCTYRVASGRILFSTLAITMLQDITGTEDILFFTLVADGLTMSGAGCACYFLYRFKIRGLFFVTGVIANVVLVMLGLSLYVYPNGDLYVSWTKVSLLGLYFMITLAGPYPILDTLITEVIPVEIKSFFFILIGSVAGILQFLCIKFIPVMVPAIGYHGIFFLNATVIFTCLLYLWFYLPETKGRSIHEIEYYFKNNTFNYSRELFKSEQTEELLNKSPPTLL